MMKYCLDKFLLLGTYSVISGLLRIDDVYNLDISFAGKPASSGCAKVPDHNC